MINVSVSGDLNNALVKVQGIADPQKLRTAMGQSLTLLHDAIAPYPPSRSMPGRISLATHKPMGYYERGRGWWYPVMQRQTLGAALGKARGAIRARGPGVVAGYKLSKGGTSETLGRRWTMLVTATASGVTGVLGNNASYAPWVQGSRSTRPGQSSLMGRYGWKSIDDVWTNDTRARIVDLFRRALVG